MNKTIDQLPLIDVTAMNDSEPQYILGSNGGSSTGRMSLSALVDSMWDRMYTQVRAVIVTCKYCLAHNAVSNPTCVSCGAPMGKQE